MEEDVESYLSERVHNGFSRPFTLKKFVVSTVESALRELVPNLPVRSSSIWVDLGLDEEIATDDEAFEKGLKEIGKKYKIDLDIYPLNFAR